MQMMYCPNLLLSYTHTYIYKVSLVSTIRHIQKMSNISELLDTVNNQMESPLCHMMKTKPYKMYEAAITDCRDRSKLHYLQWIVEQIDDAVLDKRHLIATKGSGRTFKSFYADKVLKQDLVAYLQIQHEAARLAQEQITQHESMKLHSELANPVSLPDTVTAEALTTPDPVSIPDTVTAEALTTPDPVSIPDTVTAEALTTPDPVAISDTVTAEALTTPDPVAIPDTVTAEALLPSIDEHGNINTFKLRFVHRDDWVHMQAEERNLLDSLDNNKDKGQLFLLDILPIQSNITSVLSKNVFVTSLAQNTTANQEIYGHVAAHGTLVMSQHNATNNKLGLFQIQHGNVTSKMCINSATRIDDPTHAIWHCNFPM
jgi:hypothetical protein